ncbi:MAG: DUF1820 family protein [Deltaproteobacteria bacterium]|nr:DUF1820 family protein [Candidatus Anaeroferrophillus wilburensis]MBN2888434.1 DUF1820 family protein [Deltaproteobacteria bacterium]
MSNTKTNHIYRVRFKTGNRDYSLLARQVTESEFFGFIDITDFIFEDNNRIIISPEDDALRKEFVKTDCVSVPHQYILRIDRLQDDHDIGVSYLKIAEDKNQPKE